MGVARNLALACTVTGLFAFVTGVAVTNWLGPRDEAMKIYYLNQQAISECQQKFKSKSGVIKCPNRLVVPMQVTDTISNTLFNAKPKPSNRA
jgi:hypothetical protein